MFDHRTVFVLNIRHVLRHVRSSRIGWISFRYLRIFVCLIDLNLTKSNRLIINYAHRVENVDKCHILLSKSLNLFVWLKICSSYLHFSLKRRNTSTSFSALFIYLFDQIRVPAWKPTKAYVAFSLNIVCYLLNLFLPEANYGRTLTLAN